MEISCELCRCDECNETIDISEIDNIKLCETCDTVFDVVKAKRNFNFDELFVVYQAKYDCDNSTISSVEALVRWNHPTYGVIGPDRFLQQLFNLGYSYELFSNVLAMALTSIENWYDQGFKVGLSVNVNASDLVDQRFEQELSVLDELTGLLGFELIFEITESQSFFDEQKLASVFYQIEKYNNINLSIDDYGVGYSSLKRLLAGHFKELKIDRSFTEMVNQSDKYKIVIGKTIQMAQSLGMRVVVEGVEDLQQKTTLQSLGADVLQGYLFSKPIPYNEISRILKSQKFSTLKVSSF
ncbi:hypothetical protein A1QO_00740 [Vibrio genomosp. F10 str. ZF-129]|uniref:EAL domain-containing protein n=1 Tax=Vibrio genomosp. F10 str. ZF-129 TaxID=1187848 RepID=A0A1E5BGB3_9VIBR|nr:EAL domain-containing protein [Vibrio genomosp. F10]OEE35319.1 hypothetical protein A1QO_00740 [Vibrio genomosp. F10 str. ZF-129]